MCTSCDKGGHDFPARTRERDLLIASMIAILVGAAQAAGNPPLYSVTLLEDPSGAEIGGQGLNERGSISTQFFDENGIERPYLWNLGEMTPFALPSGSSIDDLKVGTVNKFGWIAGNIGSLDGLWAGVVWQRDRMYILPGTDHFYNAAMVLDMNDHGTVVGRSRSATERYPGPPVRWDRLQPTELPVPAGTGYLAANRVNNVGEIAGNGTYATSVNPVVVYWSNIGTFVLEGPQQADGISLIDLTDDGTVFAYSTFGENPGINGSWYWREGKYVVVSNATEGYTRVVVNQAESKDLFVGYEQDSQYRMNAIVWIRDIPYLLRGRAFGRPDLDLIGAYHVNARGQIIAMASFGGAGARSFLLTPIEGFFLDIGQVKEGENAVFTVFGCSPDLPTYLAWSPWGTGSTYVGSMALELGLKRASLFDGPKYPDAEGRAVWNVQVPDGTLGRKAWFQAVQEGRASNVNVAIVSSRY